TYGLPPQPHGANSRLLLSILRELFKNYNSLRFALYSPSLQNAFARLAMFQIVCGTCSPEEQEGGEVPHELEFHRKSEEREWLRAAVHRRRGPQYERGRSTVSP